MTVLDFLTARINLSPDRAAEKLRSGFVRLFRDHQEVGAVTDGDRELAEDETVVLQPPAITSET